MKPKIEFESNIERRDFLKAGVLVFGVVILGLGAELLTGDDESAANKNHIEKPNYDHNNEPSNFNPEVVLRPKHEEFGDADGVENTKESEYQKLRREGPVFTLIHTVSAGENLTQITNRYYNRSTSSFNDDQIHGFATDAILAANSLDNPNLINIGQRLFIPVSEPVVVPTEGKSIKEIANKWGFSEVSVLAVNSGRSEQEIAKNIYLPVQKMPQLKKGEAIYIVKSGDAEPKTYFGIAKKLGTGMSTLIGRNRPRPDHLEMGHILIASAEDKISTTTTSSSTTTTTVNKIHPSEQPKSKNPGDADGITPEDLMKKRGWNSSIAEAHTAEADTLEQNITVERLQEITLSPEKYKNFVASINKTDYVSVYEDGNTTFPGLDKIEENKYFIIHHTAQGYDGVAMEHFTSSMVSGGLSVQWAIDRDGQPYQLVTNPLIACQHARGVSQVATGVELLTDSTRAQGSVTDEQLEHAMYLAYYVVTDIYRKDSEEIKNVVRGHREVNDELHVGTAGKPDFFKDAMVQFRAKLEELAKDLK